MTPVRPAISARCLVAVVLLIGLAVILPAPGHAAGGLIVTPERYAGPPISLRGIFSTGRENTSIP